VIDSFSGEYRFLSNFAPCPIRLGGLVYPSTEAAYQAAKTRDPNERLAFTSASASAAKALGRAVTLRPGWEKMKEEVMLACLRQKFKRHPYREKLIATGTAKLIEGNHWGDTYWGVCNGKGENRLGELLMQVRDEIQGR
jgi:ribA/ribD-fused uncharacterized protein